MLFESWGGRLAKVLHVITHLDIGGAESVVKDIISFVEKDSAVFACVNSNNENVKDLYNTFLSDMDVKVFENPFGGSLAYLTAPLFLLYFFFMFRPRIVHSHTDIPDFVTSFLVLWCRFFCRKIKFIRTIHNTVMWPGRDLLGKLVEMVHSASISAHVSKGVLASYSNMLDMYGLEYNREDRVVYNYVGDVPKAILPPKVVRRFLFIGRFEKQKGLDILLDAMKLVSRTDVRLDVIGTGSLDFSEYVNDRGNFLGAVYGAKSVIRDYDCLIVPSRYEGLGLVAVEGAMARIPVVIADIPGLNETHPIQHPLKFSFDGNASSNLAEVIEVIAGYSEDEISQLVSSVAVFVHSRYGLNDFIEGYSGLYK